MLIAGTLELASKVRYGITSRGVPIFRFIPYDKRFLPMAVGCSQRNLSHNIHAIVEPGPLTQSLQLQKANLVQNLGQPTDATELQVLLTTYAYDSRKELKTLPKITESVKFIESREFLEGKTFHIDPPGCRDVDDSFTIAKGIEGWNIAINIADVAERVQEGDATDTAAKQRATSFYTTEGTPVFQMLPQEIEEVATLLPGSTKLTVSLCFKFANNSITDICWKLTQTQTTTSYTYDQADVDICDELQVLRRIAATLGYDTPDSHIWVERLMIFYNTHAGILLAKNGVGILRRHKGPLSENCPNCEDIPDIPEIPEFYESAEYCLPGSDTRHYGLKTDFYAYASSPLRRYADLVNQRSIKSILKGASPAKQEQCVIDELNRRQKQAKAFSRDLFFMTTLSSMKNTSVQGIVLEEKKVWVPIWKRLIKIKSFVDSIPRGAKVNIQWHEAREHARWKERIVFKVSKYSTLE